MLCHQMIPYLVIPQQPSTTHILMYISQSFGNFSGESKPGAHGPEFSTFHEHPARTSKDSDICDLSNISDIKICIMGNGNIHIFKHPVYLSKDLWDIYI